jgi:acetyl esterase/lipase
VNRRSRVLIALIVSAAACLVACDAPAKHYGPMLRTLVESRKVYDRCPLLVKDLPYKEDAAPEQRLDVFRAPDATPRPVIVFIHGGYWQSGNRRMYALLGQTMADDGFVTAIVDYRLYPGVRYPAFMEDAADALSWVVAHIAEYGGDPDRVLLTGHSAGSHIASLLVLDDQFRRRLNFDLAKLRGVVLLSGAFDFERDCLLDHNILMAVMGAEHFREAQPINHPRADIPPTLIVNGDHDNLTSEAQAARFAQTLQTAGAPAKYVKLPGGDHQSVVLDMAPGKHGPAYVPFIEFAKERTAPR